MEAVDQFWAEYQSGEESCDGAVFTGPEDLQAFIDGMAEKVQDFIEDARAEEGEGQCIIDLN